MKINGCLGCNHCFQEKGICVQKDDMQKITDALCNTDAFIIASPVYFWSVSAQTVNLNYQIMNDLYEESKKLNVSYDKRVFDILKMYYDSTSTRGL